MICMAVQVMVFTAVFHPVLCLIPLLLLTQLGDAATSTPVPAFQVTPPSGRSLAVTSQPSLYHDSSAYDASRGSSAERHLSIASWNHSYHGLRETSSKLKDARQDDSGEQQKDYLAARDYIRNLRDAGRDPEFTSNQRGRENSLYNALRSQVPRGDADSDENEVVETPKQPFPPAPGAGYVPPGNVVEQSAHQVLGFQQERDVPRVEYVTADCFNNYMKIAVQFNGSFDGLVYSTGYAHDADCIYVNGSGADRYEFSIRLNTCGTLGRPEFEPSSNEVPDRNHFMWNTITVQYNAEIEEDLDEHFQVTCEYGYEFRRTVTFPVVGVEKNTASPYLVTLSPPQCYMEVRSGFSPTGGRLAGPVTVGDPLTLMIHMESDSAEFDVAVSSCYAHNGAKKRLQLIDANGCIVKDQLMSPFRGVRNGGSNNHVALYAYFKAFRFTSSPALYLECDVHMCHGTCPAQRCHWKSLTKRSADLHTEAENSSLTSENIQLFQALQVLQEPADETNAGKRKLEEAPGNTLCLPVLALTAVSGSFVACLLLSTAICVLLCLRMKRLKEAGDMNNYMTTSPYMHKQLPRKRI